MLMLSAVSMQEDQEIITQRGNLQDQNFKNNLSWLPNPKNFYHSCLITF